METVGYCVRVQALEGYGDIIAAMPMSDDYTGLLAVQHHGDKKSNKHYHIVIRTAVKQQAFRVRLKKLFPDGKGNQHMSITQWDGDDRALSYLFHELEPDEVATLIARKGLTDEYISELRMKNDSVKVKVAEAKKKASVTLEDDAYLHFRQRIINDNIRDLSRFTDTDIGTFMFLHALRNGKYPPQTWLVRAMVARVRFRLLEGDERREELLARGMASDIFERYN